MSTSQPSKQVTILEVPKVKNLTAEFQYNFFVPDEAVQGSQTGVPAFVLAKPSDSFDTKTINQLSTRIPRFVKFSWTPVAIPAYNKNTTDQAVRDHNNKRKNSDSNYIKNNLSKIVSEDTFASENFTTVNLNDQSINSKLQNIVSGTAALMTSDQKLAVAQSPYRFTFQIARMTSNNISFGFLHRFISQPDMEGVYFFDKNANKLVDDTVERLKNVNIHTQVNAKFFNNIVNTAIVNPYSTFSTDYTSLHAVSKVLQHNAISRPQSDQIGDEYRTMTPCVSYRKFSTSTSSPQSEARIVGFIIDKYEIMPNGQQVAKDPIIIESGYASSAIDVNVSYYSTYVYSVRTIAELIIPAIIGDTNELVMTTVLVSSHPTRQWNVQCIDLRTPSTPWDFNFRWDYENRKLVLHWVYPPNLEQDVKKFQVFRRKTINEPFQLVQVYDFDNSIVKAEETEIFNPDLVETDAEPKMSWMDPDFDKSSTYIYALATIDAHGLSSGYSEQFQISFNKFTNQLIKKRISSSGAPKPFPNMYLDADAFVDLMHDSGHSSVTVVFSPDFLGLYNGQRQDLKLLTTIKNGGKYRFSFINTDIQIEEVLDVTLDDRRLHAEVTNLFQRRKTIQPILRIPPSIT